MEASSSSSPLRPRQSSSPAPYPFIGAFEQSYQRGGCCDSAAQGGLEMEHAEEDMKATMRRPFDGDDDANVGALCSRRKGRASAVTVAAFLATLACAAALYVSVRLVGMPLAAEERALLEREYGMSPLPAMAHYSYDEDDGDGGKSGGVFSGLPLLGRSKSGAKARIQAQDEVRSYRDAFLNRPKLLETEESNGMSIGDDKDKDKHGKKGKHHISLRITAPLGCESTVILLRHCEKGDIREHCDYLGYERSVYLATLFGDKPGDRWPGPSYVYALNPGERSDRRVKNEREVETVKPLADKFNLTLDDSYGLNEVTKLSKHVFHMLRSGEMCGKVAVVSWKHEDMPRLAHHLGCGPFEGCPMDYPSVTFDDAWQIKYVYMVPWNSHGKADKHGHRHVDSKAEWKVFGNVQREGFDPLKFSKEAGDYPKGGTETGGRWMPESVREDEKAVAAQARLRMKH